MERLAQEPDPDTDGEPIVIRLGFTVAGGVVSALLASFPASLRLGEGGTFLRGLEHWIVLAAVCTPVAVVAGAVMKRARVGVRLLVSDRDRALLFAMGVLWWCVLELALLTAFGAVLRKTTHQHSLAGVTFAVFAVVSGILVALFARRTTLLLASGAAGLRRTALAIAGGCAFVAIVIVGARLARAEGMHAAAGLVDALLFLAGTTFTSSRWFMRWRPVAIAGVPVAVLVMMVGLTTLRFEPALRQAFAETAPLHALVLGLFSP